MDRWYTKNARRRTVRTVRLSRWLSKCGVASRKAAAGIIERGRVEVNGRVVRHPELGIAAGRDRVSVDGRPLEAARRFSILLHKPVDVVTTAFDPEGRRTVYDLLPREIGWVFPVGRLDRMSSGLLLLTNDTRLGERLTNHEHGVPKSYVVKLTGSLEAADLDRLSRGVRLDDGYITRPAEVRLLPAPPPVKGPAGPPPTSTWIEMTIDEGKNRQIRRMGEAIGHPVERLKRVRIGPLTVSGLASGAWRRLTEPEEEELYAAVELRKGETADGGND
ncbi:MAG: rRNA pseudouridine synthase [Planctomycetes bacterium]|nr:rRNA pseudouridine synthase [Planctomycetota bacterium]